MTRDHESTKHSRSVPVSPDPRPTGRSGVLTVDGSPLAGRARPFVMAHRGASAIAIENSLDAFRIAIEAGADVIETDLQLTVDGHIVCFHDETAERMTGEPLRVATATAWEVDRLRLRAPGGSGSLIQRERIPRLEEVLELVPPDVVLALELKDARFGTSRGAALLADALRERIAARGVFAISFDLAALHMLRRYAPDLPIGHITLNRLLPFQSVDLLGPFWRLLRLNPFYVRHAHANGRLVAPLDPDPHARLAYYVRKRVDAILTADPEETRRRLDRLRQSV